MMRAHVQVGVQPVLRELLRPTDHPSLTQAGARMPTHMRVSLAFVDQRINVWLRFGRPVRQVVLDRWRRVALFAPGAVCCRIKWLADDHGTVLWQLMVLQAPQPFDDAQSVAGVVPGAQILLLTEGGRNVHAVLAALDHIESLGLDPCAVAPTYWRTVGNRLAARQSVPQYTVEQHAAHLAREALR